MYDLVWNIQNFIHKSLNIQNFIHKSLNIKAYDLVINTYRSYLDN